MQSIYNYALFGLVSHYFVLKFEWKFCCNIIIVIIIIIIITVITIFFMQGIYTYMPETNNVPKEYNVAAILWLLFMVPISLVPALTLMYVHISTFRSMCAVIIIIIIIIIIITFFMDWEVIVKIRKEHVRVTLIENRTGSIWNCSLTYQQ
jgi:protein-S-isoprenylcysteine O-methyltransferase Ste14